MKEVNKMTITEAYEIMQDACGIKVGDTVKILRTNVNYELGSTAAFHTESELERSGRIGIVCKMLDRSMLVRMPDGYGFQMPFFILEVIEKAKQENMLTVNGKEYSESTIQKALQQYVNEK